MRKKSIRKLKTGLEVNSSSARFCLPRLSFSEEVYESWLCRVVGEDRFSIQNLFSGQAGLPDRFASFVGRIKTR
jgi:hypothetical protein